MNIKQRKTERKDDRQIKTTGTCSIRKERKTKSNIRKDRKQWISKGRREREDDKEIKARNNLRKEKERQKNNN